MRSRLVALLALAVLGTACTGADEGVKTAPDTTVLSEIPSTPLPSTSTAPDLTTLVPRTLVALGDSFASGVGARTMTPTCGRSAYGWTGLLAEDLGMNFVNLACSGATLPDTVEQVNQLPANADVVAITTGGNSLKFGQAVVRCLTGKCEAAWETAQANLSSIRPDTLKLLKDTHQAVPGVSAIALTLYPAATRPGLLCGKVTDEISTLFPRGTAMLNAELRAAAEEAIAQGVPVVVIDPVEFSTHTLCSDEPWFHDFNKGLLVMHLNDAGYEAMAAASLAALLAASK